MEGEEKTGPEGRKKESIGVASLLLQPFWFLQVKRNKQVKVENKTKKPTATTTIYASQTMRSQSIRK